ncbi:hypothetical protein CVT25_012487 [Psilocybe cyanescens]|uniref:Uncharacterized protein n=1 Tax=Psilocybe cyanescens TaxID=93625 RepID=A0A409XHF0_PSICY|nr:hypothetical protein CVT25_012487 [Psilocybe cyanescens]
MSLPTANHGQTAPHTQVVPIEVGFPLRARIRLVEQETVLIDEQEAIKMDIDVNMLEHYYKIGTVPAGTPARVADRQTRLCDSVST